MTAHDPALRAPDAAAAARADAILDLLEASARCPDALRAPLLENLLDAHRPGTPVPAWMGHVMKEARLWAEAAARAEIKAYAAACWERMGAQDRKAFIEHLLRGEGEA